MSYILDALKKSDRERQRERQGTLVVPQAEYRVRRHEVPAGAWSLMVLALVLVAAVAGALLAYSWRTGESAGIDSTAAQPEQAPQQVASSASPVSDPGPATAAASAPVAEEPEAVAELLEIWQLTEAEQRYLQELAVSLHVFSAEPSQRTVIVNGLRVREGQPLGQDLRLLEITPDGLILEFQHKRVHLATVQGS